MLAQPRCAVVWSTFGVSSGTKVPRTPKVIQANTGYTRNDFDKSPAILCVRAEFRAGIVAKSVGHDGHHALPGLSVQIQRTAPSTVL